MSTELTIFDGEGMPIPAAELEFAGTRIPVEDGKGTLRCGDFVKGKHEPAIWLTPADFAKDRYFRLTRE